MNVWPAAELEPKLARCEALATSGLLFLRQILRSMAKAAGIIAVFAKYSNSTATAAATYKYSTMLAEIGGYPLDAEDLAAVVVVNYFDAAIGEPHVPHLGITERVGIDIGAVIAWDGLT